MGVGPLHLMKFTLNNNFRSAFGLNNHGEESQREGKGERKGQLFKQSLAVV